MFRWLAAAGVAWLALLALFVAGLQPSGSTSAIRPSARSGSPGDGTESSRTSASNGEGFIWKVTRATSAHRVMIVDVEALRIEDARAIAVQVVEPVRAQGYEEILVYVRKIGPDGGPTQRIQWTPARGYTEMAIGP